jgi:16S rRNA (guanine1207-N2)-methyltransferase
VGVLSHYFTKDNDLLSSNRKTIRFLIHDHPYEMETDIGVFSKAGLDYGTRVLLENLFLEPGLEVLDLGCGYGPIGIVVAKEFSCRVTMADINTRAVELARDNAKKSRLEISVVQSDGFSGISGTFDAILTNPPIRTGKAIIYSLFESAKEHLKPTGRLFLVINKNQGAESALAFLRTVFPNVDILAKKSGYYVVCCKNH